MDLSRKLTGLTLEHPLMNAAGTVKNLDDVKNMAKTAASAIVLGSITMDARPGNSGNVFAPMPDGTYALNSLGLPNPGLNATKAKMADMLAAAHDAGKPLIVSVAGFSPPEYGMLAEEFLEREADMVELNLGCPNVWGSDGNQKRIASFDAEISERIFSDVTQRVTKKARVSVKLSPLDPFQLAMMAKLIERFQVVKAVVCCNTFPNALMLHPNGTPVIDSPQVPNGLAGLSGAAMKPIALGQVKQMRALLPADIDVIGAGGVSTGADLQDFLRAGADAVQCATAALTRGGKVFSEILAEYVELA